MDCDYPLSIVGRAGSAAMICIQGSNCFLASTMLCLELGQTKFDHAVHNLPPLLILERPRIEKPPPKATARDISTPREAFKKQNLLSILPIGMREETEQYSHVDPGSDLVLLRHLARRDADR